MRTGAQKHQQSQQGKSGGLAQPSAAAHGHKAHPILHMQRTIGNQALQRLLQATPDDLEAVSDATTSDRFSHDFSRIPVPAKASVTIQSKLAVNTPGDIYEGEADRISEQVMRIPEPELQRACPCGGGCRKECQTGQPSQQHERLQKKLTGTGDIGSVTAPPIVHEVLSAPGHSLDPSTRGFMEPRFGHDLSHIRIHTDRKAAESARAVKARAYTVGNDVVFGEGEGEYSPRTLAGQRLLAHELVHTLQQSMSASVVQRQASLDIALRSPTVTAQVLGSEMLDSFELNSHVLTAEHKRRLLALATRLKELLREHQLGTVEITGHADATGDEALNDQLGQDRADAVAAFLRRAGVPAVALLAESAGESALRVPTDNPEPRNRRVEIRFLPELPIPSPSTPQPGAAKPPEKSVQIPLPENLCAEHPEICDPTTTKPEVMHADPQLPLQIPRADHRSSFDICRDLVAVGQIGCDADISRHAIDHGCHIGGRRRIHAEPVELLQQPLILVRDGLVDLQVEGVVRVTCRATVDADLERVPPRAWRDRRQGQRVRCGRPPVLDRDVSDLGIACNPTDIALGATVVEELEHGVRQIVIPEEASVRGLEFSEVENPHDLTDRPPLGNAQEGGRGGPCRLDRADSARHFLHIDAGVG
ncbi:MAG: eCIS core domain-containing protein [Pseudonocardiaceae bacterium]